MKERNKSNKKGGSALSVGPEGLLRIAMLPTSTSDRAARHLMGSSIISRSTTQRSRVKVAACMMTVSHYRVRQKLIALLPPVLRPIKFELHNDTVASTYRLEAASCTLLGLDSLADEPQVIAMPWKFDSTPDQSVNMAQISRD